MAHVSGRVEDNIIIKITANQKFLSELFFGDIHKNNSQENNAAYIYVKELCVNNLKVLSKIGQLKPSNIHNKA